MKRVFAALACLVVIHCAYGESCLTLDPELAGRYRGECRDGLAEGHGDAQGIARYQGEFHAGRKHGKGVKIWPSGERYEGGFVDDRKQGYGVYTWANGERYEGGFENDRRSGFGTYTWPDGKAYRGQWENDRIMGSPEAWMLEHARVRARLEEEARASVAKPGTPVCRQLAVGISEQDWIRGMVVGASGLLVNVRVEDPGRFPHTLNGTEIAGGALVWDVGTSWMPCIK
ncbi:MAG: hypothetical protein K2P57_11110 [Burkholderiales bacterium]|nr:hypothetical protein [Burkholderiales bacterium]